MFQPAGPDDDLHDDYGNGTIDDALAAGDRALQRARELLALDDPDTLDLAERASRDALARYAHALNWAEDTAHETAVHDILDQAGHWVRHTFGCHLDHDFHGYHITCPVRLGHTRVGLSIGGTAIRICSLCGQDISECDHQRGTAYLVPGGIDDLPWCRVCRSRSCTAHTPDQTYRVTVVSIITEMQVEEVSLVNKPAQPDARITALPVPLHDLRAALGDEFTPGMPVNCDFCLHPCGGLNRPDLS